jgi:uncharacterized protein YbjT (DUF2867 family)
MKTGPDAQAARSVLAGASGLVGREIVTAWAAEAEATLGALHLLLRRPDAALQARAASASTGVDFANLATLPASGTALCALGTTIAVAGSQAAFRAVDHDAVLAFARAAQRAGARRFGLVSALGASPRSGNFYSRTKGETEAALQTMGFERLVIARPALLAGNRSALAQAPRPGERLALAVLGPLNGLIPLAWRAIEAATVARALLRALAAPGPAVQVLDSAALQRLGRH